VAEAADEEGAVDEGAAVEGAAGEEGAADEGAADEDAVEGGLAAVALGAGDWAPDGAAAITKSDARRVIR
jgi:hypothetical protein